MDGFTYFGSMAHVYENQLDMLDHDEYKHKQIIVNDFVIPSRN